jgi:ABC-2 type transport system ATP-binding protein
MDIKISKLRKCFGEKTAVDIDELVIRQGEILGLVGNNGAGKTTLFRLILDLMPADGGEVTIGDVNTAKSEEWKHYVGSYIDDGFLIDFLTPEEYFDFIGKVSNLKKEDIDAHLAWCEKFMAGEVLGQKKLIRDFSAGNKQKIGIVAALLSAPQIVILDEPFNFLDPSSQNVLKKLLTSYAEEKNATVLVSSHNLQHTVEISTRVTLLEHGVIVKDLPNVNQSAEKELESYFNVG